MAIFATTPRSLEQRGVLVITRTVAGSVRVATPHPLPTWREAGSLSDY